MLIVLTLVSIQMIPKEFGFNREKLVSANNSDLICPRTLGPTCSFSDTETEVFILTGLHFT